MVMYRDIKHLRLHSGTTAAAEKYWQCSFCLKTNPSWNMSSLRARRRDRKCGGVTMVLASGVVERRQRRIMDLVGGKVLCAGRDWNHVMHYGPLQFCTASGLEGCDGSLHPSELKVWWNSEWHCRICKMCLAGQYIDLQLSPCRIWLYRNLFWLLSSAIPRSFHFYV